MRVSLIKYPKLSDWMLAKQCALVTVDRDAMRMPTKEWEHKILAARHSPIRVLDFLFYMEDIPYFASVHLARHVHATPFVQSQRNDRQDKYDRNKAPQDSPVRMCYLCNAEELMVIANKRLCMKADPTTRQIVQMMCDEVLKTNPEFEGLLVPMGEYRNGLCQEFDPCGLCVKTVMEKALEKI